MLNRQKCQDDLISVNSVWAVFFFKKRNALSARGKPKKKLKQRREKKEEQGENANKRKGEGEGKREKSGEERGGGGREKAAREPHMEVIL